MGNKKQYKRYPIENSTDACAVLGDLIINVIRNLEVYKMYAKEARGLLDKAYKKEKNQNSWVVDAKDYEDVNDKLLFRQREILKFVADHQDSSFSYINVRKVLIKKDLLKNSLDDDNNKILSEFLDIRNWSFHNPQSRYVASKEVAEKNIPKELKEYCTITTQLNPIIIEKIVTYDLKYLVSLIYHTEIKIQQFESILECMKKDYQYMFDNLETKSFLIGSQCDFKNIQFLTREVNATLESVPSEITELSMAIQKSKYDGSEEAYLKWTGKKNNTKE